MKRLSSAVIVGALMAGSLGVMPAQAATTITTTGSSSTSGTPGNTRVFTGGTGTEAITVTASAWSINGGSVSTAYLGAYGNGLGVTNRREGNGSRGQHTIDNGGSADFVLLEFSRPVSLLSALVSAYGDTDVTFASLSSAPVGPVMPLANFLGSVTSASNSFGGTASRSAVNGSTAFSSLWTVGALYPANDVRDAFKLRGVSVEAAAAVPEPSTWAMMLLGFGAIGGAMRARRTRGTVAFRFA